MTVEQLIAMVTEGLPDDQKAIVTAAIQRDAVKAKANTLKQADEYQSLVDQQAALQAELEGDAKAGKYGARSYKEWYTNNFTAVEKMQKDFAAYEAKYGKLDGTPPKKDDTPVAISADDIKREVDKRIQEGYAPKWSELVTGAGDIIQRHMFAGRKTPIDFKAVTALANEKHNNNLAAAYDEWDKPERDKADTVNREAEIKRRVDEEMQKRGASMNFTPGADLTPGTLSARPKVESDKFDKTALRNDMAREWMKAGEAN